MAKDETSTVAKPETGAAAVSTEPKQTHEAQAGATPAESSEPKQRTVEEIVEERVSNLKGALDKERAGFKTSDRERKKLAQHVEQLTRQLTELQSSANKPDPKAQFDKFLGSPPDFVSEQVSASEQRIYQALLNERIASSRELAMHQYPDFEEVEEAFLEACRKDPAIGAEADKSRHPALVAYRKGKEILAAASGERSRTDETSTLKAEIAALKARLDGGQTGAGSETDTATARPAVPRSNVGTRGSGVGTTTTFRGPTPAGSVYGRHKQQKRA